ncbi:Tetratricopeptide repeat-containing protein [Desulfonema limicola]|uniref:Tetratricopeptide repeat-containing protein n=1 Tax=Desulfonema limicola TaxID=45656 RepID=A0A975GIG2_9BACT|nr:tetratricopeptide repeat protein [Desulfonema limicola]QTA81913.1 Tetratricopeptide repeat-containing protein [Desulfonema limicola]
MILKKYKIIQPEIIICLVIVLSTFAIYWQVKDYDFVSFDDKLYIIENSYVKNGLTPESIFWAFSFEDKDKTYWIPLTWLSYMLDYELYGLNPGKYHLTNLFIHIINSLLLFYVFRKMTGEIWKSAFIAAIFAVHPLNVESVAWIAQRKNVLSTFFWMLTTLFYINYAEKPSVLKYISVFFCMLAGLMAKPMLVTLPCVFVLLDYWPLKRLVIFKKVENREYSSKNNFPKQLFYYLILEKIPLLMLSFASVSIFWSSLEYYDNIISKDAIPVKLRLANAAVSYLSYIKKMIWPSNLSVFYTYPDYIPSWKALSAFFILLIITFAAFYRIKKNPYLITGWLWYMGTLFSVSGITQNGLWPEMADRWAYVPLVGIYIIIAWECPRVLKNYAFRKKILYTGSCIILAAFMVCTYFQAKHWTNTFTLFKNAVNIDPDNWVAHNSLGVFLAEHGKIDDAILHFSRSLQINPSYAFTYNNLGTALAEKGRFDKASEQFLMALKLDPDYTEPYYNLGLIYTEKGDTEQAVKYFFKVLNIDPEHKKTYNKLMLLIKKMSASDKLKYYSRLLNIMPDSYEINNYTGVLLAQQGKADKAVKYFIKALNLKPGYEQAHINLGNTFARLKDLNKAVIHFSKALQINPGNGTTYYRLGTSYAQKGDIETAVKYFKQALQINPDNAHINNDMGRAFMILGKNEDAAEYFKRALEIKPDFIKAAENLDRISSISESK